MIPWEKLDIASVPGSVAELRLMRRGAEFSIMHGSIELMSSRKSGSEEALATLACEPLAGVERASVLIGGLGMGFTLRAALRTLGASANVVVAELVPAVISWARGPMSEVFEASIDDPRVLVHEGDVVTLIAAQSNRYDAILLDVDNGPQGLTRDSNDRLYSMDGLAASRSALKQGGVLAVWSSGPDKAFTKRLERAGFDVEEVRARAVAGRSGAGSGARHVIWLARHRR